MNELDWCTVEVNLPAISAALEIFEFSLHNIVPGERIPVRDQLASIFQNTVLDFPVPTKTPRNGMTSGGQVSLAFSRISRYCPIHKAAYNQ